MSLPTTYAHLLNAVGHRPGDRALTKRCSSAAAAAAINQRRIEVPAFGLGEALPQPKRVRELRLLNHDFPTVQIRKQGTRFPVLP